MIYLDILEIYVFFTTKKLHADVLEQDDDLCPFAISQQLYTLLDRKKQTFYVNS
jgi:hypothetical protein